MMGSIPELPVPTPVWPVNQVQKLTDVVSRAAAQASTLGTTLPPVVRETSKAVNGSPNVLGYDKKGDPEKEPEETGKQLNLMA